MQWAAMQGCRKQVRRWMCSFPRIGPKPPFDPRRVPPIKAQKRLKDWDLDETLVMHKRFRAVIRLKDLLEQSKGHVLNIHALGKLRDKFHFEKARRLTSYPRQFPGLLKLTKDEEGWVWMELTDEAEELVAQKQEYMEEVHEAVVVRNIRKLLMMSQKHRLNVIRIGNYAKMFRFPQDYRFRLIRSYPEYFKVIKEGKHEILELTSWDPELAVTVREQRLKDNSLELDELMGDINPHSFPMNFPRGFNLRRKTREYYEVWQQLPFPSPYEPCPQELQGMQAEKRNVALVHEILSLSVEKYARINRLVIFRRDFKFTHELKKLVERHQGIFYTSYKENEFTVFLKEAYRGIRLIDRNPLLDIEDNFIRLCLIGPGSREFDGENTTSRVFKRLDPDRLKREVRQIESFAFHHGHVNLRDKVVGLKGQKGAMRRSLSRGRDVLIQGEEDVWKFKKTGTVRELAELEQGIKREEDKPLFLPS